jgi:hypothetical protein
MSEAEILDKYFANAEFGGRTSRRNAEEAVRLIQRLEGLDSLTPLIKLFTTDLQH